MVFIKYGNHTIESTRGEENVFYDGEVVSSKVSRGMKSDHSFHVKEDGEDATYDVKLATKGIFSIIPGRVRVKIEVFRNGKSIYSSE
jgi:hypothetical protein